MGDDSLGSIVATKKVSTPTHGCNISSLNQTFPMDFSKLITEVNGF